MSLSEMTWRGRVDNRIRQLRRVRDVYGPAYLTDFAGYDAYWRTRGSADRVYPRWAIVERLIPSGSRVLDVGCGAGDFLAYLLDRRKDCVSVGVDESQFAVELARAKGVTAHVLNAEREPLTGSFDVVTCLEVLEHVPDSEALLRNLGSVGPDLIIVSVPNIGFIGCRLRLAVFGRFPITLCVFHMKEHLRFWSVKDFREWAEYMDHDIVFEIPQEGVWAVYRIAPKLLASGMIYGLRPRNLG